MRIGLALGGGVARGLAHVGVLSVLERERIPIHCVAGTSAGAIIGSMYAAGIGIERIRELALGIKWWHLARPVFPIRGWVTFAPLERWLVRKLGDLDIRDLKLPFAAVATDLEAGQPYVMRDGRLAPAVRGSCSVPVIVTPLRYRGRLLCDGGVSDNLPVSVARSLGADYVIGVNLFDPLFPKPRNLLTVGFAAAETLVRRAGGGVDAADCLVRPDLIGQTYVNFSKKLDLIARGEIAAEAALPQIREAMARAPGAPREAAAAGPNVKPAHTGR
jgi:NTE family protein